MPGLRPRASVPARPWHDERVIEAIAAEVMAFVHYWWEVTLLTGDETAIPEPCRELSGNNSSAQLHSRGLNLPIDELHRRIHGGHRT